MWLRKKKHNKTKEWQIWTFFPSQSFPSEHLHMTFTISWSRWGNFDELFSFFFIENRFRSKRWKNQILQYSSKLLKKSFFQRFCDLHFYSSFKYFSFPSSSVFLLSWRRRRRKRNVLIFRKCLFWTRRQHLRNQRFRWKVTSTWRMAK